MLKWDLYNKLPVDIQKEYDFKWGDSIAKLCLIGIGAVGCMIAEGTIITVMLNGNVQKISKSLNTLGVFYMLFLFILIVILVYIIYYLISFYAWKQKVLITILNNKNKR